MECKIKNISAGEVIKIMRKSKNISQEKLSKAIFREATNSTQSSFAMTIGKTNDWAYTIEAGVNEYYANHLFLLANKYEFEIIIRNKNK